MALRSDKFRDAVKDRTPLLDALEGTDSVLREHAGETLATLGVSSKDDIDSVTALLGRPEADLRRYAVRILLAGLTKADTPLDRKLEECLFDPDEGVRVYVCRSRLPTKSTVFATVAVEDGSYHVRAAADLAARQSRQFPTMLDGKESLKRLLPVVDPKGLLEIAGTIEITDADLVELVREPLGQMTRGEDLSDRINAFVALKRLDNESAPRCERFLQSILLGWDAHARLEAALAFRKPSPASVAILAHRREVERDPDVRAAIDRALAGAK